MSKKVRFWTFQVPFGGSNFGQNDKYFPNAFQALILSMRFTCFVHFSNRCTLKKHCISVVKHVFQHVQHFYHNVSKTQISHPFRSRFLTFLALFFHTLFGIDFCNDFQSHFRCVSSPKWLQKGSQNQSKTAPKTHPKNHRKNDADLQRDAVCDLSRAGGRKAHDFECAEGLPICRT